MHQRPRRKIGFHKETLRILAAEQLATVAGREPRSDPTDQCLDGVVSGPPNWSGQGSLLICIEPA